MAFDPKEFNDEYGLKIIAGAAGAGIAHRAYVAGRNVVEQMKIEQDLFKSSGGREGVDWMAKGEAKDAEWRKLTDKVKKPFIDWANNRSTLKAQKAQAKVMGEGLDIPEAPPKTGNFKNPTYDTTNPYYDKTKSVGVKKRIGSPKGMAGTAIGMGAAGLVAGELIRQNAPDRPDEVRSWDDIMQSAKADMVDAASYAPGALSTATAGVAGGAIARKKLLERYDPTGERKLSTWGATKKFGGDIKNATGDALKRGRVNRDFQKNNFEDIYREKSNLLDQRAADRWGGYDAEKMANHNARVNDVQKTADPVKTELSANRKAMNANLDARIKDAAAARERAAGVKNVSTSRASSNVAHFENRVSKKSLAFEAAKAQALRSGSAADKASEKRARKSLRADQATLKNVKAELEAKVKANADALKTEMRHSADTQRLMELKAKIPTMSEVDIQMEYEKHNKAGKKLGRKSSSAFGEAFGKNFQWDRGVEVAKTVASNTGESLGKALDAARAKGAAGVDEVKDIMRQMGEVINPAPEPLTKRQKASGMLNKATGGVLGTAVPQGAMSQNIPQGEVPAAAKEGYLKKSAKAPFRVVGKGVKTMGPSFSVDVGTGILADASRGDTTLGQAAGASLDRGAEMLSGLHNTYEDEGLGSAVYDAGVGMAEWARDVVPTVAMQSANIQRNLAEEYPSALDTGELEYLGEREQDGGFLDNVGLQRWNPDNYGTSEYGIMSKLKANGMSESDAAYFLSSDNPTANAWRAERSGRTGGVDEPAEAVPFDEAAANAKRRSMLYAGTNINNPEEFAASGAEVDKQGIAYEAAKRKNGVVIPPGRTKEEQDKATPPKQFDRYDPNTYQPAPAGMDKAMYGRTPVYGGLDASGQMSFGDTPAGVEYGARGNLATPQERFAAAGKYAGSQDYQQRGQQLEDIRSRESQMALAKRIQNAQINMMQSGKYDPSKVRDAQDTRLRTSLDRIHNEDENIRNAEAAFSAYNARPNGGGDQLDRDLLGYNQRHLKQDASYIPFFGNRPNTGWGRGITNQKDNTLLPGVSGMKNQLSNRTDAERELDTMVNQYR